MLQNISIIILIVLSPVCDDIIFLSDDAGLLKPPDRNNDGMYDIMDDCTWVLQAPVYHSIRAAVLFMDIQFHPECAFDFLEVCFSLYRNETLQRWRLLLRKELHLAPQ